MYDDEEVANQKQILQQDMVPLGAMLSHIKVKESSIPLDVLYNDGMETKRTLVSDGSPKQEDKIVPIEIHMCQRLAGPDDQQDTRINKLECQKIEYDEFGVKKIPFKIRLEKQL